MYRCTECNKEFTQCPDFCDCGNDSFEEFYDDENVEYYSSSARESVEEEYTKEELAEMAREKKEKQKSLIVAGVVFFLCIVVLLLPPHRKTKMKVVQEKVATQNVKLPKVDSFWNDEVPSAYKKADPLANLPLLNESFKTISPVLREYLVDIGNDFNRKWDTSIIKGEGECKVVFTINKEGNLDKKKILVSSNNESLDNSVLLVLSKLNSFPIPPDDYNGEKIYITFKVSKDGSSHVVYPNK